MKVVNKKWIFENLNSSINTNSNVKIVKGGDLMSSVKSMVVVILGMKAWQRNSFFLGAAF